MKPLIFLTIFMIVLLAFSRSNVPEVTNDDLKNSLSDYPELYDYSDFHFSNRVETSTDQQTEVTFEYRYTRTAKSHIAIIDGNFVAVDNDFINTCTEYLQVFEKEKCDCQFVTEIGTVEHAQGSHGVVVIDKWGLLSTSNIQKKVLSEETFNFLSAFLKLFKSDK